MRNKKQEMNQHYTERFLALHCFQRVETGKKTEFRRQKSEGKGISLIPPDYFLLSFSVSLW